MEETRNEQIINLLKEAIASSNENIDAFNSIISRCEALQESLKQALSEE